MQHSQKVLNYMKKREMTPYRMSKETGITESLFSKWKRNPTSDISVLTLQKIGEVLEVSVDTLIGEKEEVYTQEEVKLIAAFRELDTRGRTEMKLMANREKKRMDKEAEPTLLERLGVQMIARGGEAANVVLTEDEEKRGQKLLDEEYPELAEKKEE